MGELKALRKEREEELPVDDRLAKKLGQLKAAKGRVEEVAKECDEHLATFKQQQAECLSRIDKAQALHRKESAKQVELEQEIAQLRVAQSATLQRPAAGVAPPAAPLPTDPAAIQVLISELAGVVESCEHSEAKEEATKFREAADSNKSFLAILFNAIHIQQAAAERKTAASNQLQVAVRGPVAPGEVGDQRAAAAPTADDGMQRGPKRDAEEAALPETSAVLVARETLIADLGLGAADAARKLEADDKAGVL